MHVVEKLPKANIQNGKNNVEHIDIIFLIQKFSRRITLPSLNENRLTTKNLFLNGPVKILNGNKIYISEV